MTSNGVLTGQNVLITGGGSGIGAAIAIAFAEAGASIAIAGRRASRLVEVAASAPAGSIIRTYVADVADRPAVAGLFESVRRDLGPIDILVNSAGINIPNRALSELTPEDWDRVLKINATGAFNAIHSALPEMRRRGGGLIINICSVAGIRTGMVGGTAYNASKFAMSGLSRSVGEEEHDHGIRVTTIYPGEVETPILDERKVPVSAEHRARILQPEDLAAAALMVACLPPRARVAEMTIIPTSQSFT